ncbi:hypothetical protein [Cyanobium gracile]|uniref:Uncharacterized protein n=1 Tax=Cyanobium gracile UHCC 0281 TaxID=3110309 RepID=A0ABU5STE0_9CYAN|nr:hypothetical protein [Cyanobium gracile]MEA5441766.1 hypothetical protein [Cyanobium gracile UHCC 0281]
MISALGIVAISVMERWLADISSLPETHAARDSLAGALWYWVLPASAVLVALGVHIWRVAARAQSARRFPPPGQPVVRDTAILQGQAAVQRARWLRILGVLLVASGAGLVLTARVLIQRLVQGVA